MELRVLGALEVWHDGVRLDLRAPKPRRLLTILATRPDQPVSSQMLIDELWEGEAPRTAGSALRSYITEVRRALEPGHEEGQSSRLPLTALGYVLRVAPEELDSSRFIALVEAGTNANQIGDPAGAESQLEVALSLWRGSPLADAHDLSAVTVELARLYGLRVRAIEQLGEARLALGRDAELVDVLIDAIDEFPLHEAFVRQLMLALYRTDRQAEALRAYKELANRLEELGLQPSAHLRELEADVLLQKVHLEPRRRSGGSEAVMVRSSHMRLIGRREELRQLLEAYERAVAGECSFVLLSGPAGIGKTTVASEFCERARCLGAFVLEAACHADDGGGYEAFSGLLAAARTDEPSFEPSSDGDVEVEQLRRFEAMSAAIRNAAAKPVVVLVEDLHWAGSATLLALRHILRFAELHNLLVVGTVRADDLDPERERVIGRLAPSARTRRLPLAGLDDHETRSLIRAAEGNNATAVDVASQIRDATDGNPFFICALLRDLAEQPAEDRSQLEARIATAAPTGVRMLIDRAVERVSDDARVVLDAAAILGGEITVDLVEAVSALPHRRVSEAIEELLGARFFVEIAAFVDRFAFPHALVRNAVYLSIAEARRVELHRRAAQVLEHLSVETPSHLAIQIAQHYCEAAATDTERKAAEWAERAGAEAARRFSFVESADWYARAIELGGPASPNGGATRLALGLACDSARQFTRARAAYFAAADWARNAGDAVLFADAAIEAAPAWTSGQAERDELQQLVEDALALLEHNDPARRVRLLGRLATMTHYTDHERQHRFIREACVLAQQNDVDRSAIAVAEMARHLWLTHDPAACRGRLEISRRALEIARDHAGVAVQLLVRRELLADLLENGEMDAFDAALDEYEAEAETAAIARDIYWAMALRATQATTRGDLPMAEQLARGALLRGRELHQDAFGAEFLQQFVLRYQQGRLNEVVGDLRAATDMQPAYRAGSALGAIACVETGHEVEAVRRVRWALGPTGDAIQKDVLWLGAHVLFCGVAARANDVELAERLDELIAPCSEQVAVFGAGGAVLGPVHYWRGLAAATAMDPDRAEDHLGEAIRIAEGIRAPFWVAQAQLDLAELLARRGHGTSRAAVDRLAAEALASARRLGFGRIINQAARTARA